MQKITINPDREAPTPSKQVVAQSSNEVSVQDSAGRTIVLRKPNPLTKLRFIDAMGESSSNKLWAGTVWPLMYVASIDGGAVPAPSNKAQIEALYQRLDEHGYEAVSVAHEKHFSQQGDSVDEDLAKK